VAAAGELENNIQRPWSFPIPEPSRVWRPATDENGRSAGRVYALHAQLMLTKVRTDWFSGDG